MARARKAPPSANIRTIRGNLIRQGGPSRPEKVVKVEKEAPKVSLREAPGAGTVKDVRRKAGARAKARAEGNEAKAKVKERKELEDRRSKLTMALPMKNGIGSIT